MKTENKILSSENDYLKKVLSVNTPLLQSEKENTLYQITKVTGNKAGKSIEITFLITAKDENKKLTIEDISIIDMEGNEYKADLYKSSRPFPELSLNTSHKLTFSFKDIKSQTLFIKIFRFKTTAQPERNTFEKTKSNLEFKDFKISWN
ncbi:transposase [Chryseobacterium piscicola]|uniref:Transposase n=1 Tax=Chryseobacterium piscicola TaxID=551459 RepID=A0A2S7KDE3_9FLAO|nr:transposase [Chryseobacterium piscicola]